MKIGVLDLQGAVIEHVQALERCGVEAVRVKKIEQLNELAGLIIPGGESTTIGKLIVRFGFDQALQAFVQNGGAIYGTCAGLILLATEVSGSEQYRIGLVEMTANRNAFGRQVHSFEAELEIPILGAQSFRGVFIRAPYIEQVGNGVEVLAQYNGKVVAARQGRHLVTAFHPELTHDDRIHQLFISMIEQ